MRRPIQIRRVQQRVLRGVVVVVRLEAVGVLIPDGAKKPRPLADDRPADGTAAVPVEIHFPRTVDPSLNPLVGQVVGLHRTVREEAGHHVTERVGAFPRDGIDGQAVAAALCRPTRFNLHLPEEQRVGHEGERPFVQHAQDAQAVDVVLQPDPPAELVLGVAAHALAVPRRPAKIRDRGGSGHARCHRQQHAPAHGSARQRLERFLRNSRLLRHILRVDERRVPGDRHRFLERSDPQFDVDRRREPGRQHNPFASGGVEA